MKPKEFDELVRQKFDQNDFAYNPKNWDRLAEQMDGRAKKRSIIMWWWIPLAGMAASVALAVGVTSLMRQSGPATLGAGSEMAQVRSYTPSPSVEGTEPQYAQAADNTAVPEKNTAKGKKHNGKKADAPDEDWVGIKMSNAVASSAPVNTASSKFDFMSDNKQQHTAEPVKPKKPQPVVVAEGYNTFKPEDPVAQKPAKFSITLGGGVNHGNQASGYSAGATIRKMINDKVYVESDVAFATSDNVQKTEYLSESVPSSAPTALSAKIAGKSASIEASKDVTLQQPSPGIIKTQDVSYSLYYAQVSPSIGYKILKRMSVGMGPDFQKMLVDNRPAPSTVDRGNLQVAPMFDVGFIGKTEYALTKKVKAGVSYRKGINNVLTPTDKYIDRDYLQFQIKCIIFNK